MDANKVFIKNMVCDRCIYVVKSELNKLNISFLHVNLGEVVLPKPLDQQQKEHLRQALQFFGFEILDDKKSRIIEKVKALVIDLINNKNNELNINYSEYLSKNLGLDYSYISNLFSSTENITIEKYIIHKKIEKVKELIVYDELNLNEIADLLNYSSVQALSAQFKKITGFTPSHYKNLRGIG